MDENILKIALSSYKKKSTEMPEHFRETEKEREEQLKLYSSFDAEKILALDEDAFAEHLSAE